MPQLCKVAPNTNKYHIEDVHRAGGIMAILGELDRGGKLHLTCPTVHSPPRRRAGQWDIPQPHRSGQDLLPAGPAGIPTQVAFSQNTRWPSLDLDRAEGCIRSVSTPSARKAAWRCCAATSRSTAAWSRPPGVDDSLLVFEGPAHVVESRTKPSPTSSDKVVAGDVVVVRYEGPKGGPGMQEMLYPTSYIKSKGLGKACALLTDGRFSGGTSALSIGHCSPEAAAGGAIGLGANGDRIPHRHPQPHDQRAVER